MNVSPVFQTPYERGGVIAPGLPILPHGVERYPVPGGGSRAVPIDKGVGLETYCTVCRAVSARNPRMGERASVAAVVAEAVS